MRGEAVKIGVSQISGGSRTSVGGYVEEEAEDDNSAQFDVNDTRTLNELSLIHIFGMGADRVCEYKNGRL